MHFHALFPTSTSPPTPPFDSFFIIIIFAPLLTSDDAMATDQAVAEDAAPPESPAAADDVEERGQTTDDDDEAPATTTTSTSTKQGKKKKKKKHNKVKPAPMTSTPLQPYPKIPLWCKDWTASLLIGIFTVSHWRGCWTLFDNWTCQQPQDATGVNGENFCFIGLYGADDKIAELRFQGGITSYWVGAICTVVGIGMIWAGLWTPQHSKVSIQRAVLRFVIVYILGLAAVNQWRGIWYITDELIWKDNPLASNWLTTCVGAGGAFLLLSGASLLAPPATFLVDGPGLHQPPIGVTILSSYYSLTLDAGEKPPRRNAVVLVVDFLVSFFGLPWLVVWYWRGCWQLQDWYFWGLADNEQELLVSLGWSALLAFVCTLLTCEPIMYWLPEKHNLIMAIVGRLRTLILSIGAVAFWRIIWNLWDLGGTTNASVWSSEVVSVFCLTAMGCASCITAPPSTLGVDVTPNPKCADEPLFAMLPIPWEILFWWGIGRNPCVAAVEPEPVEIELAEPQAAAAEEEEEPPRSVRSWRPGLVREEAFYIQVSMSYFDVQHPDTEVRACTEYCQNRPGLHQRHRSQFFRNR